MSNRTITPEVANAARKLTPALVREFGRNLGQAKIADELRRVGVEFTAGDFMDLVDEVQRLAANARVTVSI